MLQNPCATVDLRFILERELLKAFNKYHTEVSLVLVLSDIFYHFYYCYFYWHILLKHREKISITCIGNSLCIDSRIIINI